MGGGIMQIIVTGKQNKYITGNPETTHFKSVYFRHTNGMRAPSNFSHGREETENCRCYQKKGGHGVRLQDVFTIANSDNMDKFGSLYEYHQKMLQNPCFWENCLFRVKK